jgi:DNA-binding MarR family transcriptional regulator
MGRSPPKAREVDEATVAELFRTVGRLRRRVRRGALRSFDAGMSEAQAELLRLVAQQPGVSIGEAASELGLANNTVSTLVSQLARRKLLARKPDPADRRVGRLRLTAVAQRRSDLARKRRQALLAQALGQLNDATYAALLRGLDALAAVADALELQQGGVIAVRRPVRPPKRR